MNQRAFMSDLEKQHGALTSQQPEQLYETGGSRKTY